MSHGSENVGIALSLVVAAGAATAVGASVVFFPSIVKLASRRVLAGSLGFSGGVMSYVSFVEILQKSVRSFEDAGHKYRKAYAFASICFFAGVLIMMILNHVVAFLLGGHKKAGADTGEKSQPGSKVKRQETQSTQSQSDASKRHDSGMSACPCHNAPIDEFENMAKELREHGSRRGFEDDCGDGCGDHDHGMDIEDDFVDNLPLEDVVDHSEQEEANLGLSKQEKSEAQANDEAEKKRLVQMGINTAVAIGLHNFPEGLATFVAALADPRIGGVLAFAIAIHNIPEGLCVALPIYYATGNRLHAFFWALLSGASEFFAALLGWAVLANVFSDDLFASLYGVVAGMMVIISIRELLPTAHFYDPEDTVVTHMFILGMALIAISLVLFAL